VDAHDRVFQLWQRMREESVSGQAVRLLSCGGADALGLVAVDVAVHRRLLPAGAAQCDRLAVDDHRDQRVCPSIPPQTIQPLQLRLRRSAVHRGDDDLQLARPRTEVAGCRAVDPATLPNAPVATGEERRGHRCGASTGSRRWSRLHIS